MAPVVPTVRVRPATPSDRTGMARVHVTTWKATYRGMGFDERLDQLSVESDLAAGFGSWLADPPPGVAQFVAVESGGVIGFAMGCPARGPDAEFSGELGAIYVLPGRQGHGVGSALVREVVGHLAATGHSNMIVWVLEGNPYRRFYERLGGVVVRHRTAASRIAGIDLPEVAYGWSDLGRVRWP